MYTVVLNSQGRAALTVNIHRDELDEINKKLQIIQDFHGINPGTARELFMSMIAVLENQALSGIAPAAQTDETAPSIENMVHSDEIEIIVFERTKELSDECNAKTQEIETLKVDSTVKTQEIESLKAQLAIYEDMDIETIEIEKPFTPGENDIYIPLDDNHAMILRTIAQNRAKRKKLETPQPISDIVQEIVFRKETLHNWSGGYWTGL
jgi:hypothetical protein